jgi:hypothetical protein
MGCLVNRDVKTKEILNTYVRDSASPLNPKKENGKPIVSLLYNKLVGTTVGSEPELGLAKQTALSIWAITTTPLFRSQFNGTFDKNGEPEFKIGTENKGSFAYWDSKDGTQLMRIELGDKRLRYESNTALIAELVKDSVFEDEPILPEMKEYLEKYGQDALKRANASLGAALEFVTDADAWEKAKSDPDYEKKNFRMNAMGQKERIDGKGHLLTGTSFNGNNQVQHLTKGFDNTRWNDSLTMGENLGNMFWNIGKTNAIDKSFKLLINDKLVNYAEFVKEKNTLFYNGTDKGSIIHLRNQRQYARNQEDYDTITGKINALILANNARGGKLTENAYSFVETIQAAQDQKMGINKEAIVFFEKVIHAPVMGIHGVIDKMVIRPDGKMTITEIKSSGFLDQNNKTFSFFRTDIQGDLAVDIEVSTLNKAKVQLVQNMMAVALTYPGIRFSLCGIENLASIAKAQESGFTPLSKREVSDIMKMLLAFYKAEKALGNKSQFSHIYDQLMALDKIAIRDIYLNPENVDAYVDVVELKYVRKGDKKVLMATDKSEDRLKILEQRLAMGVGMHADMNRVSNYIKFEGKDSGLGNNFNFTEDIKEILAIFSNLGDDPAIFNDDISWANKWIGGTTSNVSHPVIQIYNEYFHAKKLQRDKAALKLRTQYDAHFLNSYNEWAIANGMTPFSGTNKFSERFFTSGDATKFWAHFYKEINVGSYTKTVRITQAEATSKTDKALLKFLDDYYESVLSDTYTEQIKTIDKDGKETTTEKKAFIYDDATYTVDSFNRPKSINHLEVFQGKGWQMGNTNNWNWLDVTSVKDENGQLIQRIPFTPNTSMLPYEYEQRYEWDKDEKGNPIKSKSALIRLKNTFLKHLSGFFDRQDNYKGASDIRMVELKYLGSESENIANYSMDLGAQFGKFMENIESKRHMDTVLAIAEAISTHSENTLKDRGYNENQINIADWLRKQARWQIKGERPDDDPVRNNRAFAKTLFRIPIAAYNEKTGKYKEYIFTLHTIIRGMTTFASYVFMSINPKGSLLNAAQAVFTSLKTGLSMQSASKFLGMKKQFIDLTVGDYIKGLKMWSTMQESAINGDPESAKLYLLAKEMSYLPNDYSYFDIQDSFGLNPNSWKNPSGLMVMHTAVEEANALAILYAQLKSLKIGPIDKVTGEQSSAWDMYQVDSTEKVGAQTIHKLVWKDDFNRGNSYQNGAYRPTYGLTAQEVIKLKRVYERIQGNYRHEERSIVEMYVLGQFFMQFKRYLPSMIRGQFRGRISDSSLGQNVEVKRNGETVLEWRNRMTTGKYILLMNWFFGAVLRPLMSKIPASTGQLKHMTDLGSVKSKYLFSQQLSFSEMSEDEQTMVMDAMLSLSVYFAIALAGLKMEDESGKKDPWYLFLENINSTMVQPWNLFKLTDTIKSMATPVSVSLMGNILLGFGELAHRGFQVGLGYKEEMRNEKGNIPGTKKILRGFPVSKGFVDTWDTVIRKGAKGNEE